MTKKDSLKNTWVGPNTTSLDSLVEDWENNKIGEVIPGPKGEKGDPGPPGPKGEPGSGSGEGGLDGGTRWAQLPGGNMIVWGSGFFKDGDKIEFPKNFGSIVISITLSSDYKTYAPYVRDFSEKGFTFGINTSVAGRSSYVAVGESVST